MNPTYLFPHQLRLVGWLLAIPGFILGYLNLHYHFHIPNFGFKPEKVKIFTEGYEDLTNELALMLVIVGLLFVAFSRQKREDELTAKMRLNAL